MILTVVELKENEDGSAICTFDMDEEAKQFLLQYALEKLLTEAVKEVGQVDQPKCL